MNGDTTSPEAFDQVLAHVGEGDSPISACRRPGMPSKSSVLRRVRSDPSFARAYEAALEERAQMRLHRYGEILDKLESGKLDPSTGRVLLDGLKLQMQLDDRRLSERNRTEISGPDGGNLIPEPKEMPSDFETARYIAYLLGNTGALPKTEYAEPLRLVGRST
jgi:hypothetical protein